MIDGAIAPRRIPNAVILGLVWGFQLSPTNKRRNTWLPLRDTCVVGPYAPTPQEIREQGLRFKHNLAVGEIILAAIVTTLVAGVTGTLYAIIRKDLQSGFALARFLCVIPTILGLQ
jgi:hypothetical protein